MRWQFWRREGTEREEPEDEAPDKPISKQQFAVLLARDIGIAILIVLIILGAIYAYTGIWPPMVVIESSSMQHSDSESYVGVIDTGDLVLVQVAPSKSNVVTWVEGKPTGYRTYGDYGDVIIFRSPNRGPSEPPIIHRAILYLIFDDQDGYNAPSLLGLPDSDWYAENAAGDKSAYNMVGNLTIRGLGWRGGLNLTFNLASLVSSFPHDGYLTMGDNNAYRSGWDRFVVRHSRVIGVARGELPWFGLIKLTLSPSPGACCDCWGCEAPKNSWDSLAITLVMIPVSFFLADLGYTIGERKWKEYRKKRKARQKAADAEGPPDESEGAEAGEPPEAEEPPEDPDEPR